VQAPAFLRHDPYCPTPEFQEITRLSGFGAPGQQLSLACGIVSPVALEDVHVAVSDLRVDNDVIERRQIELYVVKVWEQAGIGTYQASGFPVAELLLKDDRADFGDRYVRRNCKHVRHLLRRPRFYLPPNLPLHGDVRCGLESRKPKQLWLSITIPAAAKSGCYTGSVVLDSADRAFVPLVLDLQVEVLPIDLLAPGQDLFIWYKGTLDCRAPQHYVPPPLLRAQLQDIYDHGFSSLSLNETDPARLQQAVNIADGVGFKRNIVVTVSHPDRFKEVDFKRLTPVYYVSDEMDVHGADAIRDHVASWRRVNAGGGRSMASLVQKSFVRRLLDADDIGHAPDVVSYYLPQNRDYFMARAAFPQLRDRPTYYYWLSHMEKPNLHRVLAGLYLWKSRADGIAPYSYQHLPQRPYSPFNDFDEWEPGFHIDTERRPFKDHMTTYPARTGSVPTLQWKGLCDGIVDLRYLTTLEALLARANGHASAAVVQSASDVRRRRDAFLGRITLRAINIASERDPEPYAEIEPVEYSRFRESLAYDILTLQYLLGPGG
jgi:hypothetical protein